MPALSRTAVLPIIRQALREDRARQDITSQAVLPSGLAIEAQIVAKASGVLAGAELAAWTFEALDRKIRVTRHLQDRAQVRAGKVILTVQGPARTIFAAERTALNLLGHLSGISTLTRQFVDRVRPFTTAIMETRKTLPGLRLIEKYAVRIGGGRNHRFDLAEAVLIKTNHLRALGATTDRITAIRRAIVKADRLYTSKSVEVEVTTLEELEAALSAGPDIILLDNWPIRLLANAVSMRNTAPRTHQSRPLLEVSGGVTLANVQAIARTGVDRISIGRLTHSAPTLDVSLRVA